jgi:hypothetical protein
VVKEKGEQKKPEVILKLDKKNLSRNVFNELSTKAASALELPFMVLPLSSKISSTKGLQ